MEKYNLKKNVKVFGIIVETFPEGIGEAFEQVMKKIGDGFNRSYYGISEMKENQLVYKATAEEKYDDEAEKYNLEKFNIESGTYFTVILKDWQNNTECIKDIFQKMMENEKVDKRKTCVEWYKTNDEMLCMMKSI